MRIYYIRPQLRKFIFKHKKVYVRSWIIGRQFLFYDSSLGLWDSNEAFYLFAYYSCLLITLNSSLWLPISRISYCSALQFGVALHTHTHRGNSIIESVHKTQWIEHKQFTITKEKVTVKTWYTLVHIMRFDFKRFSAAWISFYATVSYTQMTDLAMRHTP